MPLNPPHYSTSSPSQRPYPRYVAMKEPWDHGEDRRDRGRADRGGRPRRSRSPGHRHHEDDKPFDRGSKSGLGSRHDRPRDRSQDRRRRSRSPARDTREREEVRERNRGRELLDTRGSEKSKRSSHHSPSSSKRRKSRSYSPSRSHHKRSRRSSFRSPSRLEKGSSASKPDRKARASPPPLSKKRSVDHGNEENRPDSRLKTHREQDNSDKRGRSSSPRRDIIPTSQRGSAAGGETNSEQRDRSPKRSPSRSHKNRESSHFSKPRDKEGKRGYFDREPHDFHTGNRGRFNSTARSRQSSPRLPRGSRGPKGSSPRREKGKPPRESPREPPREDFHTGSKRPRSSGGKPSSAASGANSIEVKMSGRGYYGGQQGYNPNSNTMQAAFPLKPQYNQHQQADPRYSQSPQHMTLNSYQGSPPQGQSPYSGSWGNQPQQYSPPPQYPPNYQQPGYSPQAGPQGHYYSNQAQSPPYHGPPNGQIHQSYPQQNFRGNQRGFRGNHYNSRGGRGDHRGSRGGHFQNLHWNASGSQGASRGQHSGNVTPQHLSPPFQQPAEPSTPQHPNPENAEDDAEDLFRPSKEHQVEDVDKKDDEQMPPPSRPIPTGPQSQQNPNKFSFAFKASSKATPTTPKPEISSKLNAGPTRPPIQSQSSPDRPRPPALQRSVPTEPSSSRKHEFREPAPPATHKVKKIMKREKERPTLPEEYKTSPSVYFRKPGNESVVGSGTYGKVFKAVHVYTKDMVAMKKIRMEGERDGFPVTAVREMKLLQPLRHLNIVRLKETMVERNDCFMIFEYLSHDLTGLLNHPTFKLEPSHKKHLAKQLFEGLEYLHRRSILHRDIKAANILVSNEGILKIADFGLARKYDKKRKLDYTNRVITIWYRSPELLLGETQYGPAVDVWSAACVLVEIFTRHAIFPGDGGEINQLEKIYNVLGTPNKQEWPGVVDMQWFALLRPTARKVNTFAEKYKERVTPAAFELLAAMFQYDPAKRPSAADVLEHPYFTTEQPAPKQATELANLQGDWHEFESKALRKENERKDKEARRQAQKAAAAKEQAENEKKRPASTQTPEQEAKRVQVVPTAVPTSKADVSTGNSEP